MCMCDDSRAFFLCKAHASPIMTHPYDLCLDKVSNDLLTTRKTYQELAGSVRDAVVGLEKAQSQFKKAKARYSHASVARSTAQKKPKACSESRLLTA